MPCTATQLPLTETARCLADRQSCSPQIQIATTLEAFREQIRKSHTFAYEFMSAVLSEPPTQAHPLSQSALSRFNARTWPASQRSRDRQFVAAGLGALRLAPP